MATTKTKKEIIDYLWEWAEQHGNWGKLLIKKIVEIEDSLTKEVRNDIYKHFLHDVGLKKQLQIQAIERPKGSFFKKNISLKSIENVKGVNKLAKNQILKFSPNITIIYGENATGKTGYSRILKSLGLCYEKENIILPNVFTDQFEEKSALITYLADVNKTEFQWNGNNIPQELQSISVFTNDCVRISLNSDRELLVTPIGFHLFNLLSSELRELQEIHKQIIIKYTSEISWLNELHEGTAVYKFLENISSDSSKGDLEKLALFTDQDNLKLGKDKKDLKNLNRKLIENEIQSFNSQLIEINRIISIIENNKKSFPKTSWENLILNLKKLQKLRSIENKSLSEIAQLNGIEFYESEEFQSFIKAADKYLKILKKNDYPADETEICIYCRQLLKSKSSRELLRSYNQILNDTTQRDIKNIESQISNLCIRLKEIDTNLILHQSSYGNDKDGNPIQPNYLIDYSLKMNKIKRVGLSKNLDQMQTFNFDIDYDDIEKLINEKITDLKEIISDKESLLASIGTKELELTKRINELEDRKKLHEKFEEVEKIINNLAIAKILMDHSNSFNTSSVSRKTSEARENLISENFNDIFQNELKDLRRSKIQVNLYFRTEKGKSKLLQNIKSDYNLTDILSEGEQKSIALAEFLTEIQLDENNTPIIFDDPVSSLDHHIIDEVARRLVKLSVDRQVIVFTHSILLFNSIKQKSELNTYSSVEFKYYETQKDNHFTGYLYESPNLKEDSFGNYSKRIEDIIKTPKLQRTSTENELAIEGYNKLRAAIEVLVEKDILKSTVKRYRKNVALTSFEKVSGEMIDKHKEKLYSIFERCCYYTDSHSNYTELTDKPSLEGLEIDLDEIRKIRKIFIN